MSLAHGLPVYPVQRKTRGLAWELASRCGRCEKLSCKQRIEKAPISRRGLKCVWRLVREKNSDRLVVTWIHVAI